MTGRHRDELLLMTLQCAVPIEMHSARWMSAEARLDALRRNGYRFSQLPDRSRFTDETAFWQAYNAAIDALGERPFEHTDAMLYGGPQCAAAFAATARILALLAYQPGGVTFAGLHWCARRHPWCANVDGGQAPGCCTCGGECPVSAGIDKECTAACSWCRNGCGEDCVHPAPSAASPVTAPRVLAGFGPDDQYGPLRQEADW